MQRDQGIGSSTVLWGLWIGIATACGSGSPMQSPNPDSPSAPDAVAPDAPFTVCEAQIRALTLDIHPVGPNGPGACAAVVRLDHDTRAVKGYQMHCGGYAEGVTEAEAKARAQADTGFGRGALLVDPTYQTYVFLDAPPDPRGLAVVSPLFGETLLAASIGAGGSAGDLTFPPTPWRPLAAFDAGCVYPIPHYGHGFDLTAGGVALASDDTSAAWAVVESTGIPTAMRESTGGLFGAITLRYARAIDPLDTTTAEWIVIVVGGWLE